MASIYLDLTRTTPIDPAARASILAQMWAFCIAGRPRRSKHGANAPRRESEALRLIFKNYDKIQTKAGTTDKGVVVVQTWTRQRSPVPAARLGSDAFVKDGMVAMRTTMIKKMGRMMFRGMHGGMMGVPSGATAPGER